MSYTKEYSITKKMCDASGRLSLRALAKMLEDNGDGHLMPFGVGHDAMRSRGLMWILVKREITVTELPRVGRKICLETWATKPRHGINSRFYRMYTERGALIITVACDWVIMDGKTRTMLSEPPECMSDFPYDTLETITDPETVPKPAGRLRNFPELTYSVDYVTTKAETDKNRHINNSFYMEWISNLANEAFGADFTPRKVWIEYERELLSGEDVTLSYEAIDGRLYVKGSYEGQKNFAAYIE